MNLLFALLWPVFLDFGKEVSKPGTIWHGALFAFLLGSLSVFAPKVASWASVLFIAAIMMTDLNVLCFGIDHELGLASVLTCLSFWFFKAFSFYQFVFVGGFLLLYVIVPALFKNSQHVFHIGSILGAVCVLPPDISVIFWVLVIHLPATVVASREYCSGKFIFGSLAVSAALCAYFDFHGKLPLHITITYIVFRTYLYVM